MLLFLSVTARAVPADYPLRVFIVQNHWNQTQTVRSGTLESESTTNEGHGNIQEGYSKSEPPWRGHITRQWRVCEDLTILQGE